MGLQICYGAASSNNTDLLFDRIIREADAFPDRYYCFLVPEQESLEIQASLVKRHPRHAPCRRAGM